LIVPRPVITHTCLPSVTGDGDDMFCLRSMWFESSSWRFHITACLLRSIAHSSSSPVLVPVATFRKIVSPQMIGVDPLYAGSGSFHATFLASTLLQATEVIGRPSRAPAPPPGRCRGGCRSASPLNGPPSLSGAPGVVGAHSAPHETGRLVSRLTPSCEGPRQCGQCCASPVAPAARDSRIVSPNRLRMSHDSSRSDKVREVLGFGSQPVTLKPPRSTSVDRIRWATSPPAGDRVWADYLITRRIVYSAVLKIDLKFLRALRAARGGAVVSARIPRP
jgi:hypothetical protein